MRNNLSNIARAGSACPSIAHILLNKDNRHLVKHFAKSVFTVLLILIIGGIGVQTFTSCSSSSDDDPPIPPGGGEDGNDGITYTYSLENVTGSSFTMVDEYYNCGEDGVFGKKSYKETVNYSINGKTLSFWGLDFSGNSPSLAGIWTRESFSASCNENDYRCEDYDGISKAVFTQNSLTITECLGKIGSESEDVYDGVTIKQRAVDCSTREYTYTKENQTVKRVRYYSATPYKEDYIYNGKTCTYTAPSQPQQRTACTQAYNKVMAENPGYDGSGYLYLVESYYYKILREDFDNCLKDSNFPEWRNLL